MTKVKQWRGVDFCPYHVRGERFGICQHPSANESTNIIACDVDYMEQCPKLPGGNKKRRPRV